VLDGGIVIVTGLLSDASGTGIRLDGFWRTKADRSPIPGAKAVLLRAMSGLVSSVFMRMIVMSTNGSLPSPIEILGMDGLTMSIVKAVAAFQGRASTGYSSVEFLEKVVQHAERVGMAADLVDALVPDDPSPEPWVSWLSGGPIPQSVKGAKLYDNPKVRYSRQAERATGRASKAGSAAKNLEDEAAELQAQADGKLASAKLLRDEEAAELHAGRALIVVMFLNQMHEQTKAVFAMGPAWRIMSIIADLPDRNRILQDLDAIGGDAEFKADFGAALVSVWMKHRDRAAASGQRRSSELAKYRMPVDVTPEEVVETIERLAPAVDDNVVEVGNGDANLETAKPGAKVGAKAAGDGEAVEVQPQEKPHRVPKSYMENGQKVIEDDIVL
jgi:hypothetical protein